MSPEQRHKHEAREALKAATCEGWDAGLTIEQITRVVGWQLDQLCAVGPRDPQRQAAR